MTELGAGSGSAQGVNVRVDTDVSNTVPPAVLSDNVPEGSTDEDALNIKTAEWLRGYGLEAEGEQRIPGIPGDKQQTHKLDVVLVLDNECVVLEAEFHPARGVKSDALKRLPDSGQLAWRGKSIARALTIVYPEQYRRMPESHSKGLLGSCAELRFQAVERDTEGNVVWGAQETGSLDNLVFLLLSYLSQSRKWTQSSASARESAFHGRIQNPSDHPSWKVADRKVNETKELIRENNLQRNPLVVQALEHWEVAAEKWLESSESYERFVQSSNLFEWAAESAIAGDDTPWECVHLIWIDPEFRRSGCSVVHETLREALDHSESLSASSYLHCPEPYPARYW